MLYSFRDSSAFSGVGSFKYFQRGRIGVGAGPGAMPKCGPLTHLYPAN